MKKPLCLTSLLYLNVCTASTKCVVSTGLSLLVAPICFHCGSDCIAGKPKWYVNLYFLRFAKMMAVKEESSEGHSYIEPSCMASHICRYQVSVWSMQRYSKGAHCLGASVEDGCAVEVLVVLDGVAVLDDALSAAVVRRRAMFTIYQRWRPRDCS